MSRGGSDAPSSPERGGRRPTVYDVARHANVSPTTVMRVLQEQGRVSERTRSHVGRVIESMKFIPNPVARALATRETRRIGIVADTPGSPCADRASTTLQAVARRRGFFATSTSIIDGDEASLSDAVAESRSRGVNGLIVIASRASTIQRLERAPLAIPTLIVRPGPRGADGVIGLDERAGGELAVRHLAAIGHRTVAHIGGPRDDLASRERSRGWQEACVALGLPAGDFSPGEWSSAHGYTAARRLDLRRHGAIFAASDGIALGVLHAVRDRGLRVPHDVAVVGYGDVPEGRHFAPPLTTVRHDFETLGDRALAAFVGIVDGGRTTSESIEPRFVDGRDVLGPTLVVRASSHVGAGEVG